MNELKLTHIHDEDKFYIVRVCMPIHQSIVHVAGSIKVPCDECGTTVWLDPTQPIPDPPEGVEVDGMVNLCFGCFLRHSVLSPPDTPIVAPDKGWDELTIVPTTDEDRQS